MKITPFLDEKVNIYDSEMSAETIESYEKYFKNQNESNTADDKEKMLTCNDTDKKMSDGDDTDQAFESNEHDLSNDTTQNLTDIKNCDSNNDLDRKRMRNVETASEPFPNKKRKKEFEPPKLREDNRDIFCWRCHKYVSEIDVIPCYFCPRVFHLKCVHIQEKPSGFWLCTECDAISAAENPDKIAPSLSKLQKKDLAELLMFVLKRMRQHEGSSHYENPVDLDSYPDYKDYIVKPMYLALLEDNVKNLKYSSCESFLADTKWMVHNSYVFNTVHSELTLYAKAMMKNAKHECDEIINCPDCYLHANTLEEDKWFIEPCDKPHILVWARLKGFPYWPCKVMKANGTNVDVRFFGDHNKSLVPVECCYLYSKQMPSKQKKVDELEVAIKEASQHIKRLEERFHVFHYAPLKTMYNPKEEEEQRKLLLPYHDKPFFIKVKDKEKLFDPNVIKNIFDEPLSYHKTDKKEESQNNTISAVPVTLEIKTTKNSLNLHNEEIYPYRFPLNNKNMSSSCNKPTIIIEDTDSDILSQKSFNHSKQPSIIGSEKLSSPSSSNKARPMVNGKATVSTLALPLNYKLDSNFLEVTKDLNCIKSNGYIKSETEAADNSIKTQVNTNDNNPVDIVPANNTTSEMLKSDDKQIGLNSEQVNCVPLTNPSLDKYNNNHFLDKLRINSNAKLINVLTDNPGLVNNYIFKPMVVIQKLKDDVFRDYSSNISRKNEVAVSDKQKKSVEDESSKSSTGDNEGRVRLNFDLLNGNLTDLVSMTEIDLDKDELFSCTNQMNNKEAENTKCNSPGTCNGLKSVCSTSKPTIKTEYSDDDELVDSDYIERLSKSILESTLDYDSDVHCVEGNRVFCPSEISNGSCEGILVVDTENQSSKKDEELTKSNVSIFENSPERIVDLEIIEDTEEENHSQKTIEVVKSTINNVCSVVDPILHESNMNHQTVYLCEKEDRFLQQNKANMIEREDQITLKVNSCEVKANGVNKTVCIDLVKNKKLGLENVESSVLDMSMECPDSDTNCESSTVDKMDNASMLKNNKNHCISLDDTCQKRDNSKNESCSSSSHFASDKSIIKETDPPSQQPLQNKEIIGLKNTNGFHRDTDCEIVKIVFPPNSKLLKPIGFKRVKTCGGVIKKVIKNGMLLTNPRDKQSINICSKGDPKTKINFNCLKQLTIPGNLVKNHSTTNCRASCSKAANVKNVLEKCADNMVSGTERVREDNKMMNLDIEAILNKVEKIDAKGKLLQVLREELEKFEEHCKKKIESYKNAYIEEMDSLYTMEKQRWIQETMNVSENESRMMVDEIKKKQWCILCLNEAKFHCCWSTSYCSEKCQLADWPVHMKTCTQYSMRIGDPDLRLSPELRKIFKGEHQKIKDLLDPDKFNISASKMIASSPSCSSNSTLGNSSEISTKESTNSVVTSPKSSTIYVQKNMSKPDTSQGLENPGNQVMKIISNQAVHLSGSVASPNPSKSIIHVPKQNLVKHNILHQDHTSKGLSSNNKPVLFTVPLTNRNNALVSVGKTFTSNKTNGHSLKSRNTSIMMGGKQLLVPKSFLPTKVIKKTVPILANKNLTCLQDNNNSTFMNAKPLYISMQNVSKEDYESNDGLKDPLDITNEIKQFKEPSRLSSERNPLSVNSRDTNKSSQSFLIVEKSGETAQYTYKIGNKEDIEKISQANSINPSLQKSTICAVSPLPYPVVCSTPSTSTETISTRTTN